MISKPYFMKIKLQNPIFLLLLITGGYLPALAQKVIIETEIGNIQIQLDPEKAPVTCKNFMRYVDAHKYDGATFYRAVRTDNQPDNKVKIEVIQGGVREDTTRNFPPIFHETTKTTGLKHVDGSVSMARIGPGTATSEFFICINNQPELDFGGKRNPDGQGFAAFGKVISGMETVRKIQHEETGTGMAAQTFKNPVKILSMRRII